MALDNHPTKNQNPEAVPPREAKGSLRPEAVTSVEEEARLAIEDRNMLLDRVEELGGYEALGVRHDAPFGALHDAVMVAQAEKDQREADRRSRGEAGRRLGEMFLGLVLRGFQDAGREAEVRLHPNLHDDEQESRTESVEEIDHEESVTDVEPLDDFDRERAERLGLDPETATREDIMDEQRREDAELLGLDQDATREEIRDEERRRNAENLGLDQDATWDEIQDANRTQAATRAGLNEDATWDEISEAQNEQRNQAVRDVLGLDPETTTDRQVGAAILGVDPNTSLDELQRIARERALEFFARNGIDPRNPTKEQILSVLGLDPDTATMQEMLQAMKDNGVIFD